MQNGRAKPNQATSIAGLASSGSLDPIHVHQHRHVVFADPVAFRYLEEDSSAVVLERRGRLRGYELYLVEQWATSRVHPTFVITTYTGDPNHSVLVGVLGIPADEDQWSLRLRVYFKAISQYHARAKETPLGMLMVTNLSSFPSALTVIPVPDGDIRKHREDFFVNENLKRLGCSGRSGISLSTPAGATQAKFHQLYRTSDRIPFYGAVIELVKLCQVSLVIFAKLDPEYADGCLCDVTEKAIKDWWAEIGSEYFNIEPTDGVLGPTTVSALLGLLMGARNRLNYYGSPVAKDAFDVFNLKRGIAYFQKSQKLDRTRRLDRHSLNRLHQVTAKAAAGEGWAVPKAVKSTVAELSGKGGEMVMGIVGRDKAGIGDIETLDIERFVTLVHGERAKWLWFGKPRRGGGGDVPTNVDSESSPISSKRDDHNSYIWPPNCRADSLLGDDDGEPHGIDGLDSTYNNLPPGSVNHNSFESPIDRESRKPMLKSVTGKMSDARSGFGRIKDAVGLRGHASKLSRDDNAEAYARNISPLDHASLTTLSPSIPPTPRMGGQASSWKSKPEEYNQGQLKLGAASPYSSTPSPGDQLKRSESPFDSSKKHHPLAVQSIDHMKEIKAGAEWEAQYKNIRRELVENDPSVAGSMRGNGDLEGPLLDAERTDHNFQVLLHRRNSMKAADKPHNENWWPRHMSFSVAEEAVLSWTTIGEEKDEVANLDNWAQLQKHHYVAEYSRHLHEKVLCLLQEVSPWVSRKTDTIEALDQQAGQDQEYLQSCYFVQSSNFQSIMEQIMECSMEERSHFTQAIKEIEVLGARLEYEIDALVSKVDDVEDGVSQFERNVEDLEARYKELEDQFNNEGWAHWIIRSITGIGTAPKHIGAGTR